jgi:hypothetical protein
MTPDEQPECVTRVMLSINSVMAVLVVHAGYDADVVWRTASCSEDEDDALGGVKFAAGEGVDLADSDLEWAELVSTHCGVKQDMCRLFILAFPDLWLSHAMPWFMRMATAHDYMVNPDNDKLTLGGFADAGKSVVLSIHVSHKANKYIALTLDETRETSSIPSPKDLRMAARARQAAAAGIDVMTRVVAVENNSVGITERNLEHYILKAGTDIAAVVISMAKTADNANNEDHESIHSSLADYDEAPKATESERQTRYKKLLRGLPSWLIIRMFHRVVEEMENSRMRNIHAAIDDDLLAGVRSK